MRLKPKKSRHIAKMTFPFYVKGVSSTVMSLRLFAKDVDVYRTFEIIALPPQYGPDLDRMVAGSEATLFNVDLARKRICSVSFPLKGYGAFRSCKGPITATC